MTRFIADDKVVYQLVRWEMLQRTAEHDIVWSMWAEDHGELFFCVFWIENDSFMRNLTSWTMPFWLVLLTEHKVLHCYMTNAVYCCLVARQLYPSCGFSSAGCRCFQVSNHCRAIHSMLSVHHTALTDKDFLIRITSFCEIFMILFVFFCWYLGLDNFPR